MVVRRNPDDRRDADRQRGHRNLHGGVDVHGVVFHVDEQPVVAAFLGDAGDVDARRLGDLPRRGAVVAVAAEQVDAGADQRRARALGLGDDRRGGSFQLLHLQFLLCLLILLYNFPQLLLHLQTLKFLLELLLFFFQIAGLVAARCGSELLQKSARKRDKLGKARR